MGIRFAGGRKAFLQSGLAGALGTVEVRPLDLTSAYGTIANGGVHVPPRMILEIRGPDGKVVWKADEPEGERAISAQTAFLDRRAHVSSDLRFAGGRKAFLQSGLAGARGTVEVRPLDLTSAYGTIANGGVHVPPRMILEIRGPDGKVVWKADEPEGERAISAQTAF